MFHSWKMFAAITVVACSFADARSEIIFAELGGVQLVSRPVDLPVPDYAATIVELRTVDPDAEIIVFENIAITGAVHQVHGALSSALTREGNAFKELPGGLYGEGWSDYDTHLLVPREAVGGGVFTLEESNDGSHGPGPFEPTTIGGQASKAGIGALKFSSPDDAFFVSEEFRENSIDFAYIVTPMVEGAVPYDAVQLTLGVLGLKIVDARQQGGAAFGYDGNPKVNVPFAVPEPSISSICFMAFFFLMRNGAATRRT